MDEQILLTPSALFDFLTQVDELSDKEISINTNNGIQVNIGASTYIINTDIAEDVQVPDEAIDEIQEVNESAFEQICEDGDCEVSDDTVEGGIIKQLAKTLLVGGLVRLSAKLLKK